MKTHTVKSNAKRAARKLCDQHDTLGLAEPIVAKDGTWQPAVFVKTGLPPEGIAELALLVPNPDAPPAPAEPEPAPAGATKAEQAMAMIRRPGGATADELRTKLKWGPHTLRGFVSRQNSKNSANIVTSHVNKVTAYSIGGAA